MRIRTIKPEFFNHEGIFSAEEETSLPLRLAFIGLWCAADREGRFKWEPRRLGVQILPYDQVDFSRVLHALTTRGFIDRYTSEVGDFGVIPSFLNHQVINNRERESSLPNPSDCKAFDASGTRAPLVTHASEAEGKGKEGKGKDLLSVTGREEAIPFIETYPDELLTLWNSFPAKSRERSSKKKIYDEWKRVKNKPAWHDVTTKVQAWSRSHEWKKDNGQFAPGAHLWIKDRKWESDPPPADTTNGIRPTNEQFAFQKNGQQFRPFD
jgi:hypothetical protein